MRLWYAGRGISWVPLLACLGCAGVMTVVGRQWPGTLFVLLPATLACCAAAAGFVFDESATAVVAVTPRGAGWRRTTRCLVALLPAGVWVVIVTAVAGREPGVDRVGWVLAGLGALVIALGLAALAARRQVSAPGPAVASTLVMLVLMPPVVGPLAGLEPVLPMGRFAGWVTAFWVGALVLGAGAVARAVRPGI